MVDCKHGYDSAWCDACTYEWQKAIVEEKRKLKVALFVLAFSNTTGAMATERAIMDIKAACKEVGLVYDHSWHTDYYEWEMTNEETDA